MKKTDGQETSRKLVMVVDDEPDMLSMLRLVIEKKCACDVVSAPSGIVALKQLQEPCGQYLTFLQSVLCHH